MSSFNTPSTSILKQRQTCIKRDSVLAILCLAITSRTVKTKTHCRSAWKSRVSIRELKHSWRTFRQIRNIRVMIPCSWENKRPWFTAQTRRAHSWFCQINTGPMQFLALAKETWRAASWVKWIWIQIWNTRTLRVRSLQLQDSSIQAVLRVDMHRPKPKQAVSQMHQAQMLEVQTESLFLKDICRWWTMRAIIRIKIATTITGDKAKRTPFSAPPLAAAKAPLNPRQDLNSTPCSTVAAILATHIKVRAPNQVKPHHRLTKTPIYLLHRSSSKKA